MDSEGRTLKLRAEMHAQRGLEFFAYLYKKEHTIWAEI